LVLLVHHEHALSATGSPDVDDLDMDGLSDVQELVLGTQPDEADSDGDGYNDLEEIARNSDPRDALSVPQPAEFSMALTASQTGTTVTMLATMFSEQSKAGDLRLELGVVYQGQMLPIRPRSFGTPHAFRAQSSPNSRLTVVQFPIPAALVRRVGQVNVVSVLRDAVGNAEPVVSILPLVNFSGITMQVVQTPAMLSVTGGRPAGIIYRPLAGGNSLPSTWSGGEVCFQRTAAVGTNGVSVVHEVESAGCLPMDTYCSSGNCAAGVGRNIELPDPAALAGG